MQILNPKFSKARLVPFAYTQNPYLVDPPNESELLHEEMSGSGMEMKGDMEACMSGAGQEPLRSKMHLMAHHLKRLRAGKNIIVKSDMVGMGKSFIHFKPHYHAKMMEAHRKGKGIKFSLTDGDIEGDQVINHGPIVKAAQKFALMEGSGKKSADRGSKADDFGSWGSLRPISAPPSMLSSGSLYALPTSAAMSPWFPKVNQSSQYNPL